MNIVNTFTNMYDTMTTTTMTTLTMATTKACRIGSKLIVKYVEDKFDVV